MRRTLNHTGRAVALSGAIHAGALLAVSWTMLPVRNPTAIDPSEVRSTPSVLPAATEVFVAPPQEPAPVVVGQDALQEVDPASPPIASLVQSELERARGAADAQSPEERRDELERLAARLSRVSSESSIAEMSDRLGRWLEVRPRAAAGESPLPPGEAAEFDFSTAQVSDVREVTGTGAIHYVAVLVDASGQTHETELSAEEGLPLYETFQLMKRFPLLEAVYRKTVMGLLDRLIDEGPSTAPPRAASAP